MDGEQVTVVTAAHIGVQDRYGLRIPSKFDVALVADDDGPLLAS